MRIISFHWTVEALLAGAKTVTRREWSEKYARSFKAGERVQAWDKSPRYGGKKVAVIELTQDPYQEYLDDAPASDFQAEGLQWMVDNNHDMPSGIPAYDFWECWQENNPLVWVVRFKLVEVQ